MRKATRATWLIPLVVVMLLCSLFMPVGSVFAATSAPVTVNATPSYVSISLNVSTHDFGAVAESSTDNSGQDKFGVTNGSTVITTTTIVSNGWQSGGGTAWTWGAAGSDTGLLNSSDGDGAYDVEVDDTTPAALATSTAALTDWQFELQLEAPSTMTHGDPQGTTVTVSCTAD